jgi:hypothetical protein
MVNAFKLVAIFLVSLGILAVIMPVTGDAFDPIGVGVDCSDRQNATSAACTSKTVTNPLSGPGGIITKAARIVAYVAGLAAIIVIIYSGIKYITSNGDSNKIANARSTLTSALIGLLVIALSASLLAFFVSKL